MRENAATRHRALGASLVLGALGFSGAARGARQITLFLFVLFLMAAVLLVGLMMAGIDLVA
jgi:uncharacterized membrane protein YtjA (UPF0391 family)